MRMLTVNKSSSARPAPAVASTRVLRPRPQPVVGTFVRARGIVFSSLCAWVVDESLVAPLLHLVVHEERNQEAVDDDDYDFEVIFDLREVQFEDEEVPEYYENCRLDIIHSLKRWYQFVKVIGNGTYAEALLFKTHKSGRKVVVKSLYHCEQQPAILYELFKKEAAMLEKVQGYSNVCQFRRSAKYGPHFTIFMDYADLGTLQSCLYADNHCGFNGEAAQKILFETILALAACERENIVHTDIKMDNILFTRNSKGEIDVVLADFGLARHGPVFYTDGVVSSVGFRAYEAQGEEPGYYSSAVDIWSLGVIATVVFCGMAFRPLNDNYERSLHDLLSEAIGKRYDESPALQSFFAQVFCKDPARRITALELVHHEYFADLVVKERYQQALSKLF